MTLSVEWHAPAPGSKSGVADYAARLGTELAKHVEVRRSGGAVAVYHLGNNGLHRETYREALRRPGIVVLHDAVLHHFLLGTLSEQEYVDEFAYNYGEWYRAFAQELWRHRSQSGTDATYFRYGLLRRIATTARLVAVHNEAARAAVLRHAPSARVDVLPHFFNPPPVEPAVVTRLRARLGLTPGNVLFGVFGYLRETKRVIPVLRAFAEVYREFPRARLMLLGEFASAGLERACAPCIQHPGVVRMPFVPEKEWWLYASAVDAGICLRHPSAGETSGVAIAWLGLGKAVMVSHGEEWSSLPADAAVRIPVGAAEEDALRVAMALLASEGEVRRGMGRSASTHIASHHSIAGAAESLARLIRAAAAQG